MTINFQDQAKASNRERDFPELSHLVLAASSRIWTSLLLAVVLAGSLGLSAIYLVPVHYNSVSSVRILQRENYLLTTQQSRGEDAEFVRSQPNWVTHQQTLSQALLDEELSRIVKNNTIQASTDWLKSQIKAEIASGSDAMTITASSPAPEMASIVSQAVTRAYLAHISSQLMTSREKRIRELETTAAEVDEKLTAQWKLLQSKTIANGTNNSQSLSLSEQLKLQNLRENSQRLRILQFQRSQVEIQLASAGTSKDPSPTSFDEQIRDTIDHHPETISLREKIRQCELKIHRMQEIVQNTSAPQWIRLQEDKQFLTSACLQLEERIRTTETIRLKNVASIQPPNEKRKPLEVQLQLIDQEMNHLRQASNQLEAGFAVANEASEANGANGTNQVEIEVIRHEMDRQERLADQLWKTIQELRIEERAEPRVALLALAGGEAKLNRSKQIKAVATAVSIGCILAILSVGYVEWTSCIVRSPKDIRKRAGLRPFGFLAGKRTSALGLGAMGADEIVAQVLLIAGETGHLPTVFVSSPLDSEPRSYASIAIATSLTRTGKKTLLLTTDRCKELDDELDHGEVPFSSVAPHLSHPIPLSIACSKKYGFDFVKLGAESANRNWNASQSLPSLLAAVEGHYEAIVILGPAVLTSPESIVLSKRADISLLVGVRGATRSDDLSAAREQLETARSTLLGAWILPARRAAILPNATATRTLPLAKPNMPSNEDETAMLDELNALHSQVQQIDDADKAKKIHSSHRAKFSKQSISKSYRRAPE